ncbi:MAG: bifunctional 2-C-methyl-D-erythritol 4-phosphate cytidylyltransferase/2-C-methyl-D-erythritol 2,4-cyclodiphosphate synthase [Rhodospirillales bacterium]|nr:bifunctional 2-C-methyl-D-erythritol 4-phosphate cytidylyltransferase/2-C-methyl-D-erythritol 2,4-cyclodiphosphate synthase [Rhodospirillales bacterium]
MTAAAPSDPPEKPKIAAVLLAAGSGTRFGGTVAKQYRTLGATTVLRHAAAALGAMPIQPVGDAEAITAALAGLAHLPPVAGGATRQASVRAGLEALAEAAPDIVLIHDGARPFVPAGTVEALLAALRDHAGAIPALPVTDTLKRGAAGRITETVPREGLFRAQTPQAFRFATILDLHRRAPAGATDDAALLEAAGLAVALTPGDERNIKITVPEDLARMERLLALTETRTGTGFDVHAFAAGRPLVLCGITIPHDQGLAGHSDADVGIHALCDAIYGALAEGDIGRHFPPSEAAWKDADSARFLRHAAARIAARGARLVNADITLICERPKIGPHAAAMQERLAALLETTTERISVKATTTERLGFTGRGEGIAAQAAVSIELPRS